LRAALKRTRHRSAPAERRDVSRAVFAYFRWWRWLTERDSLQKQLEEALGLQRRFDQGPASFKPEALAARAIPDWLKERIPWPEAESRPTGSVAPPDHPADTNLVAAVVPNGQPSSPRKRPYPTELGWLRQLQRDPVLWIRPKASLAQKVAAALGHCSAPAVASSGESGQPLVDLPETSALCYAGQADLFHTAGFQAGDFEIQDLASQLVGFACSPRPGETWWDACAGEGGKTLHLADLMQNKGMIWASDRSVRRLKQLKERTARAQVFNYRAATWEGDARLPTKTKFDGVLVDAPCSGIGTWQRNPHARWTTQLQDVEELAAVQTRLLDHVAGSLKAGGRLVYSVCTLARAETSDVAEKFNRAHPDFERVPVWIARADSSALPATLSTPHEATAPTADLRRPPSDVLPPSSDLRLPTSVLQPGTSAFLWPQHLNANGMFIASWRKK
jgi:16S rRNA (cytosine967-C5)-methyltransferase